MSYGRLVAILAARSGHLQEAQDALGDALLSALRSWPRTGVPDSPEAWLLTAARRRWTDGKRAQATARKHQAHLALLEDERTHGEEDPFGDDRLKLMLACAHPAIDPEVRAPLMLQAVLGLDARRIASAFLVAPGTMGQRLTRAKLKIAAAGIPFEVPPPEALESRLTDVLAAIYAAYSVGFDAIPAGDAKAAGLAREALWLAGLVCQLLPDAAEAHGLHALMLFAEARRPARQGVDGRFVPLEEQDTSLWDEGLLAEAELSLARASRRLTLGRYQIEAAIQAAHFERRHRGRTDWAAILHLYDGLVLVSPTIGALTARAVALAEVQGPAAGLAALDAIDPDRRRSYQPWWAARAHLAAAAGTVDLAVEAFDQAAGLSEDAGVRAYLLTRRAELLDG